ncbi:MAG TPA: hypothetical protein VIW95_07940, partial [Candidatus Binatus sp.]
MADRNPRYTIAAIALPLLFLAMSGLARAATLTVTNTLDSGMGSLRAEILAASTGDTINFSVSGTITLGSTLPAIAINLTIDGSGQSVTVDGDSKFQIFTVNSGSMLSLQFLTLQNGSVTGGSGADGGAILNNGQLTFTDCTFLDNRATGVVGSIIGGFGNGGAIFNEGTLTVNNSTFSDNHATGGAGSGIGSFGGGGQGGAIFNEGTVTVSNSTFSDNQATGAANSSAGGSHGGGGVGGAILNDGTVT